MDIYIYSIQGDFVNDLSVGIYNRHKGELHEICTCPVRYQVELKIWILLFSQKKLNYITPVD